MVYVRCKKGPMKSDKHERLCICSCCCFVFFFRFGLNDAGNSVIFHMPDVDTYALSGIWGHCATGLGAEVLRI